MNVYLNTLQDFYSRLNSFNLNEDIVSNNTIKSFDVFKTDLEHEIAEENKKNEVIYVGKYFFARFNSCPIIMFVTEQQNDTLYFQYTRIDRSTYVPMDDKGSCDKMRLYELTELSKKDYDAIYHIIKKYKTQMTKIQATFFTKRTEIFSEAKKFKNAAELLFAKYFQIYDICSHLTQTLFFDLPCSVKELKTNLINDQKNYITQLNKEFIKQPYFFIFNTYHGGNIISIDGDKINYSHDGENDVCHISYAEHAIFLSTQQYYEYKKILEKYIKKDNAIKNNFYTELQPLLKQL